MIERSGRWLEPLLALLVLAGLVHAMWFLQEYGYLGPPFFYYPNDTWMDWFNTAYWAHQPGAYDDWRTIYPPISFLFLGLFTTPSCYFGSEGLTSRDCDLYGIVTLHGFFVLNIILVSLALVRTDRRTALPRAFAIAAGLPMLYSLERGNLILPTFACIVLAFGPLLKQAWLRWLALGLAINFKVYLIAALFPQLLRRRWRWFEGALLATILVYLISLVLFGAGTPGQIIENIISSRGEYQAIGFLDQWYASTYQPLLSLLNSDFVPIMALLGSDTLEGMQLIIPTMLLIVQASIVVAALVAWLRPEAVPMHRLTLLGVGLAFITAEPNGYTTSILAFLVFMERFRAPGPAIAIICVYLLAIPADILLYPIITITADSVYTGGPVIANNDLTMGPFLRPLLVMAIPFSLALQTIADVRADIRRDDGTTRRRFGPGFRRPTLPAPIERTISSP